MSDTPTSDSSSSSDLPEGFASRADLEAILAVRRHAESAEGMLSNRVAHILDLRDECLKEHPHYRDLFKANQWNNLLRDTILSRDLLYPLDEVTRITDTHVHFTLRIRGYKGDGDSFIYSEMPIEWLWMKDAEIRAIFMRIIDEAFIKRDGDQYRAALEQEAKDRAEWERLNARFGPKTEGQS